MSMPMNIADYDDYLNYIKKPSTLKSLGKLVEKLIHEAAHDKDSTLKESIKQKIILQEEKNLLAKVNKLIKKYGGK